MNKYWPFLAAVLLLAAAALTQSSNGNRSSGSGSPAYSLGTINAIGNAGTSQTINSTNGAVQSMTLNNNLTIAFTQPGSGAALVRLKITQASSGGPYTVTWTSVKWPGGIAPVMTSGASAIDWYSCLLDGTITTCTAGQNVQ